MLCETTAINNRGKTIEEGGGLSFPEIIEVEIEGYLAQKNAKKYR